MENEIRVEIEKEEQIELFKKFLKNFDSDFLMASNYLNIPRSSLSKYKRAVVRYLPKEILYKIITLLDIPCPNIIYEGNLKGVRKTYMDKAHLALKEKYGLNWAKELTNRRDFKGIHLFDFPNYIFIYLEEHFRKEFFESFCELFTSKIKASKFLGVFPSTLNSWIFGKQKDYDRNKEGLQFIPLSKLKIISDALLKDFGNDFSMNEIEKHIMMYRMRAGNPIKNPIFPIKEGPELTRLLFHLIGDGYSGRLGQNANYKNTSKELLKGFKEDLRIFGEVPIYDQELSIKFPRMLAEIIGDFYGISFFTFESSISSKIIHIPKEFLRFGLRAFADDEGTIYSNSVRLSSANFNLLNGIKQILFLLKLRCGEVKNQVNPGATFGKVYYLDINDLQKYSREVGFSHPRKKELMIDFVKKLKSRKRRKWLKT